MNTLKTFIARPFQHEGTTMTPNILLMCKLLVMLLVAHHIFFKIADPFIPFIPALDLFHTYPNLFNYTLKTVFALATVALFLNLKVRTASLTLGIVVILSVLASKPLFYNHVVICACALIIAGLHNEKQPFSLFVLQVSLVYLGASLNKFLDHDWWSGAFMDTWLGSARENPLYLYVSNQMPELLFAKILSYIAMFTEFAIAVLVLFKKTRRLTIWFIIIFHTTLFTMTSFRFGHFLESLVIVLIAFLSIPKHQLIVHYKAKGLTLLKQFFTFLDVDKKQLWTPFDSEKTHWLQLKVDDKLLYNHHALKHLLLYTPNFFMLLFVIDAFLYVLLQNHRTQLFVINALFVWCLIFYFLPVNWSRVFRKTTPYKSQ